MSITAITVSKGSIDGNVALTNVALTAGATGTDGYSCTGMSRDEYFGLLVENTGSATGSVWIKASDFYELKDLGDLEVVVGGSVQKLVGPIQGQRFLNEDNTLVVDSGITGILNAIQMK